MINFNALSVWVFMVCTKSTRCVPKCQHLFTRYIIRGMGKFAAFLEKNYLDWQQKEGRRTLKDYAEYLKVSRVNLTRWINGDTEPDADNAVLLADKLGPGVYDGLGLGRPKTDDRLRLINEHWDDLPDSTKDALADQAARVKERGDGQKTKSRK